MPCFALCSLLYIAAAVFAALEFCVLFPSYRFRFLVLVGIKSRNASIMICMRAIHPKSNDVYPIYLFPWHNVALRRTMSWTLSIECKPFAYALPSSLASIGVGNAVDVLFMFWFRDKNKFGVQTSLVFDSVNPSVKNTIWFYCWNAFYIGTSAKRICRTSILVAKISSPEPLASWEEKLYSMGEYTLQPQLELDFTNLLAFIQFSVQKKKKKSVVLETYGSRRYADLPRTRNIEIAFCSNVRSSIARRTLKLNERWKNERIFLSKIDCCVWQRKYEMISYRRFRCHLTTGSVRKNNNMEMGMSCRLFEGRLHNNARRAWNILVYSSKFQCTWNTTFAKKNIEMKTKHRDIQYRRFSSCGAWIVHPIYFLCALSLTPLFLWFLLRLRFSPFAFCHFICLFQSVLTFCRRMIWSPSSPTKYTQHTRTQWYVDTCKHICLWVAARILARICASGNEYSHKKDVKHLITEVWSLKIKYRILNHIVSQLNYVVFLR